LPLRPGLPKRQTHDYKWYGTTTLYAAFDILTGKVIPGLRSAAPLGWAKDEPCYGIGLWLAKLAAGTRRLLTHCEAVGEGHLSVSIFLKRLT
jgi:hypothetical protein